MKRWRWLAGGVLFLLAGLPLLMTLDELRRLPSGWNVWTEADRIVVLVTASVALCFGAAGLSMLGGLVLGTLLFKTDLPGSRLARAVLVLIVFVPLPLVLTACQMGFRGLLPIRPGATWPTGLAPAMLIHAVVGLPWCAVIIGLGLRSVEPELEEGALLDLSARQVFFRVTLRRASPFILLAGLVTGLSAWNEMAITDFTRVRTFAEEVYLQFQGGGLDERARATAVVLPFVLGITALTLLGLTWWRRALPERAGVVRPPRLYILGRWRWPTAIVTYAAGLVLLTPLLLGLVLKAGLRYATADQPGDPTWDAFLMLQRYLHEWTSHGDLLLSSALMAAAAGAVAGFLALLAAWLSRDSPSFEKYVWVLAAALWTIPGPLLAVGWLDLIQVLLELPGRHLIRLLLYERPSSLPNIWICAIRFFPVALAVQWPLVRLLPRELEEAAALEGLGPLARFRRIVVPLMFWPWVWTALIVAVLTLGEISASKLTATPGFTPLAHHLFQQMHASADAELASLVLVMLTLIGAGGTGLILLLPRLQRDAIRLAG